MCGSLRGRRAGARGLGLRRRGRGGRLRWCASRVRPIRRSVTVMTVLSPWCSASGVAGGVASRGGRRGVRAWWWSSGGFWWRSGRGSRACAPSGAAPDSPRAGGRRVLRQAVISRPWWVRCVGVELGVVGGDPAGRHAGGLGGFGGVLGEVGGDRDVGDFAVVGEPDDARVDLGAPGDVPAVGLGRVGDGGEPGRGGDLADQVGEHLGGDGRVRLDGALGVSRGRCRRGGRWRGSGSARGAGIRRPWRRTAGRGRRVALASLSRRRRRVMTVRRHSSEAWAFQTTAAL